MAKNKRLHWTLLICLFLVGPASTQLPILQYQTATQNKLSFIPGALSSESEIGNPARGYYQFGSSFFLDSLPKFDIYERFSWRQLETSKGVYDFAPIDQRLAALQAGQRFSFRVMPLNTCCTSYKNGADVPDYVYQERRGWFYHFHSLNGSDSVFVPDWNDSVLIAHMVEFLKALAAKFDGDPRIGWIENGLYGNWGEWHTYPLQYPNSAGVYQVPPPNSTYLYAPIQKDPLDSMKQKFRDGSIDSRRKLLRAHTEVFKKTRLIQSTADLRILFDALQVGPPIPIGIRRDSWGDPFFTDITKWNAYQPTAEEWILFNNRWKIAPFYSENWGERFIDGKVMADQLLYFHTSAIAFGNFGNWPMLQDSVKNSYLLCGRRVGYRYQISNLDAEMNDSVFVGTTQWKNIGMAPSYDKWVALAYLVNPSTNEMYSSVDSLSIRLDTLFDSRSVAVTAPFRLSLNSEWRTQKDLQFRIRVMDRNKYLATLNLDLVHKNDDGSYGLCSVQNNSISSVVDEHPKQAIEFSQKMVGNKLILQASNFSLNGVVVRDLFGKKVLLQSLTRTENQWTMSTKELARGVYFVDLPSMHGVLRRKFLIN